MEQKKYNCRVYLRVVFVLLLCHKCLENRPPNSLLTPVLQVLVQRGHKSQVCFFLYAFSARKQLSKIFIVFYSRITMKGKVVWN